MVYDELLLAEPYRIVLRGDGELISVEVHPELYKQLKTVQGIKHM